MAKKTVKNKPTRKGSKQKGGGRKFPAFVTPTVTVAWSNLMQPDTYFGKNQPNHNITVVLDKTLEKRLRMEFKKTGATGQINGLSEKEGVAQAKFKTTLHVDKGTFPCKDASNKPTDAVPMGTDKVRLQLKPAVLDDDSVSFYLQGIQIIEKNASFEEGGNFEETEGFSGSSSKKKGRKAADEDEDEDEDEDDSDEDETDEDEDESDEDEDDSDEDEDEDSDEDEDEDSDDEDEDEDSDEDEDEDSDEDEDDDEDEAPPSKKKAAKKPAKKPAKKAAKPAKKPAKKSKGKKSSLPGWR